MQRMCRIWRQRSSYISYSSMLRQYQAWQRACRSGMLQLLVMAWHLSGVNSTFLVWGTGQLAPLLISSMNMCMLVSGALAATMNRMSRIIALYLTFLHMPFSKRCGTCRQSSSSGWLSQLIAPLKVGGAEMLPTLVKLGSAVSLNSLRRSMLQRLGSTLLTQHARYEAALAALCHGGGRGVAAAVEHRMAVQVCTHRLHKRLFWYESPFMCHLG